MSDNSNTPNKEENSPKAEATDFIRAIIKDDLQKGKHLSIRTRFPPEPNGYLHIGHAKSICLNFGLAKEFNGLCNLRMDDTNPCKEEQEYVDAIKEYVHWLGFDWEDRLYYASDYFEQLYQCAEQLIMDGKAYVCELTKEETSEYRGTLTGPGQESPYRNRPAAESLDLFRRMRAGEFEDGSKVLRAKIDMNSPNVNMRDPVIYRIRKIPHQHTGDKWCIYPMYDYAHCISDAIEGITHSICTLEFENHRPLYDWFLNQLENKMPFLKCHSQQIEFARLNLTYTLMSKRKLLTLVKEKSVNGWNDPRMPTLAGMRRRGYTPRAIRNFCEKIGVGKTESTVDFSLLEFCIREDLNAVCPRVMAILNPLKIVIDNYPENQVEYLEAPYHPEDASWGTRKIPFSRNLYIEREDFMENPPKGFFRLSPGKEVRLRYAYFLKCVSVVKDSTGEITEIHCTYDPETKGGNAPDNRKVKSTLHWLSSQHALTAEARLYDHLFIKEFPEEDKDDFRKYLNPKSLEIKTCYIEPSLGNVKAEERYQFERLAYFYVDPDSTPEKLVFNRIITLRDAWTKVQQKEGLTDKK